jgi:2-polyprenyl-3-methyl-5-hydroxy-6-metoxy-1,4-benzoquinol methylase
VSDFVKEYYERGNYADYSSRGPRYAQLAFEIVQLLKQLNLIDSSSKILDYECGFGFLINGLLKAGQENVSGFDISAYATSVASSAGLDTLDKPDGDYDIMFALDVFEHMTDAQIDNLFDNVRARIVVGRIPVSTDGIDFHLSISRCDATHINCKTKKQWTETLTRRGYKTILRISLFSIYDTDGVFCFLALA